MPAELEGTVVVTSVLTSQQRSAPHVGPTKTPEGVPAAKRSLRGPRWRGRVSFGHGLMVGCGLLAFVFTASALRRDTPTVEVLVAAADLAPGDVLDTAAVRAVPIPAGSPLVEGLVPASEVQPGEVRVAEQVVAGEPVRRSALRSSAEVSPGNRAMSVPIDRTNAVGGELRVGDRVDVVSVSSGKAGYVLTGATVVAVAGSGEGRGGLLSGGAEKFFVTVEVDDASALAVSAAIADGSVQIIRSTGAPTVTTTTARQQPATPATGNPAAGSTSSTTAPPATTPTSTPNRGL